MTPRHRGLYAGIGAAVLVAATAGAGGAVWLRDDRPAAAAGTLPTATAPVRRETLVDRQSETGQLAYGDSATVTARLGGTITWLAAAGAGVGRGGILYRVDDTPVVLLYGTIPPYRTLASGDQGRDVEQFERNLAALGYRGFTVDRKYTAATARAVKQWQHRLGLPRTGAIELGRVLYAPGPIRVDSQKMSVGDAVQPGAAVLVRTGTARVVTVELDLSDRELARIGAAVAVTLPNGTTTSGLITGVATVVETGDSSAAGGSGAKTKVEVTIAVPAQKALAGLDQATVDVGFTASRRVNVLTVPVGALLALSEGGYGVQVIDGTTSRIVAVRTGLFAAGRVEITGAGLTAGLMVGVPS